MISVVPPHFFLDFMVVWGDFLVYRLIIDKKYHLLSTKCPPTKDQFYNHPKKEVLFNVAIPASLFSEKCSLLSGSYLGQGASILTAFRSSNQILFGREGFL